MMYIDNQGNGIEKAGEIYARRCERTDHLSELTKEERIAWFKQGMYLEPLNFVKEIDGTLYAVRAFFKEDAGENITEKVERIVLKKE